MLYLFSPPPLTVIVPVSVDYLSASLKLHANVASTLFQINVNKERDAKIGHSPNMLQHKPSTVPCSVPVISSRT